jgi:hypothetical protein
MQFKDTRSISLSTTLVEVTIKVYCFEANQLTGTKLYKHRVFPLYLVTCTLSGNVSDESYGSFCIFCNGVVCSSMVHTVLQCKWHGCDGGSEESSFTLRGIDPRLPSPDPLY